MVEYFLAGHSKTMSEQISTMQHVEEPTLEQVGVLREAAACGDCMLAQVIPEGPQPVERTHAGAGLRV